MPAAPAFQAAFGLAVKGRRGALEITQEQLANNTGLHQRWISNVETGTRNRSYGSLGRLANRYKYQQRQRVAKGKRDQLRGNALALTETLDTTTRPGLLKHCSASSASPAVSGPAATALEAWIGT